jgi:hypothetical protein
MSTRRAGCRDYEDTVQSGHSIVSLKRRLIPEIQINVSNARGSLLWSASFNLITQFPIRSRSVKFKPIQSPSAGDMPAVVALITKTTEM